MISVGNDIVDLQIINIERTRQAQFYNKILQPQEVALYNKLSILPFESFVWLMWSIKEAVYKFFKRNNPALAFSPKKIVARALHLPANFRLQPLREKVNESGISVAGQPIKSVITFNDAEVFSTSLVFNQLVHSIVYTSEKSNIYQGIKHINPGEQSLQSVLVRRFAVQKIENLLHLPSLKIVNNAADCPLVLNDKDEAVNALVSLSHHGSYVAYAVAIDHAAASSVAVSI